MSDKTPMKTVRMTPEFMREIDALNPKGDTRTLQIHVTTDGADVPREKIEDAVRRMIQDRISGKAKTSTTFEGPTRVKRTAAEFFAGLNKP